MTDLECLYELRGTVTMKKRSKKHVVIIGAGFAGLWALKGLNEKNISISIIDKNNYHTFLPLLYQVAAAEIEPEQIAYPIRNLLRKQKNMRYIRSEIHHIDYQSQEVHCNGQKIPYDYLVIATGSKSHYYGVKNADRYSFDLKSLDEAMILRNHVLACFERASYTEDPEYKKRLLTFSIIGGGPTGVEFAGALAELVKGPLRKDFPDIKRNEITIYLIESSDRVLNF